MYALLWQHEMHTSSVAGPDEQEKLIEADSLCWPQQNHVVFLEIKIIGYCSLHVKLYCFPKEKKNTNSEN